MSMLFSSLQGVIEEGLKQRKERAVQISQSRVRAVIKWLQVVTYASGPRECLLPAVYICTHWPMVA